MAMAMRTKAAVQAASPVIAWAMENWPTAVRQTRARGPTKGQPAPEDERPHGGVGDPGLHHEPAAAASRSTRTRLAASTPKARPASRADELEGQVAAHGRHTLEVQKGDGDDGDEGREEAPRS